MALQKWAYILRSVENENFVGITPTGTKTGLVLTQTSFWYARYRRS